MSVLTFTKVGEMRVFGFVFAVLSVFSVQSSHASVITTMSKAMDKGEIVAITKIEELAAAESVSTNGLFVINYENDQEDKAILDNLKAVVKSYATKNLFVKVSRDAGTELSVKTSRTNMPFVVILDKPNQVKAYLNIDPNASTADITKICSDLFVIQSKFERDLAKAKAEAKRRAAFKAGEVWAAKNGIKVEPYKTPSDY